MFKVAGLKWLYMKILFITGDDEKSWKQSQLCYCENTSLRLRNNSVQITAGGFYYIFVQVTFTKNPGLDNTGEGTVILIANENVDNKSRRILSKGEHGEGTVSFSTVINLLRDETVELNISLGSLVLLVNEPQTYWGLYLLHKQNAI